MLLEKIISGKITAIELTSKALKDEINFLFVNIKQKIVMKFISKLSTGKQTVDLVAFYKAGNKAKRLCMFPKFKKVLDECTENGKFSSVEIDETFYQYQNTDKAQCKFIQEYLKEGIVDLSTDVGKLEARKRLATLAVFLKKQPKAEAGELLKNGYSNWIGKFKTTSGSMFFLSARWIIDGKKWHCIEEEFLFRTSNDYFWSSNKPE